MPEWELNPFNSAGDDSPQTLFKQIEQELEAVERRKAYLLEERRRVVNLMGQMSLGDI